MQTDIMAQLALIVPELLLALSAVALLLLGAFSGARAYPAICFLAVAALAAAVFALACSPLRGAAFDGALILDSFGRYAKILALLSAAAVLLMSFGAARAGKFDRFEFPVLALLASLGMLLMISAGNMLALYMGLELHSLALYVMAALNRENPRSTEAGLKYFILGSLASGLLLYGISLLYGFSGHLDYPGIAALFKTGAPQLGLVFGLVFVLAGAAFKISAVPFHMWTPDVYEGAPTPVSAFFATASKIAAVAMVTRIVILCFGGAASGGAGVMPAWQQIVIFIALASMFLGAFAGIAQRNIKRLIAYSSITHIGYILAGLAAGGALGAASVLLYLTVYAVMMLGCFAFILCMNTEDGAAENIDDLAGLARNNPFMAGIMTLLMFSLAGIPPLSGFFGKWYVFAAAVQAHLVWLAVAGMIAAAIAAFYYLRLIKVMWFDKPKGAFLAMPKELQLIMLASGLFTLFYVFIAAWFQPLAEAAAQSLF